MANPFSEAASDPWAAPPEPEVKSMAMVWPPPLEDIPADTQVTGDNQVKEGNQVNGNEQTQDNGMADGEDTTNGDAAQTSAVPSVVEEVCPSRQP